MNFRHNILATLAYYDILDQPLKLEEISSRLISFRHLFTIEAETLDYDLEDVHRELERLTIAGPIDFCEGYYFLFGREYLVPLRLKREKIAKNKWRITKKAISWLRLVPYLRAIFASGSLAINNTDELSDLDVLIVVKHGRIWLARFFIVIMLELLHVRRRGHDKIAPDKICPNHYITDESLAIAFQSIYNAQTYSNLVPIYVRDETLTEKFKKENSWVLDYVENWATNPGNERNTQSAGFKEAIAKIVEKFLDLTLGFYLEGLARVYQTKRIVHNQPAGPTGGHIVFNDQQLAFHPSSIEDGIIQAYNLRLMRLGISQLARESKSPGPAVVIY
jgi:hypothetical protein